MLKYDPKMIQEHDCIQLGSRSPLTNSTIRATPPRGEVTRRISGERSGSFGILKVRDSLQAGCSGKKQEANGVNDGGSITTVNT
jgi:hypothetical protein